MIEKPTQKHGSDSYAVFRKLYDRVNEVCVSMQMGIKRKDMDPLTRNFTDAASDTMMVMLSLRDKVFNEGVRRDFNDAKRDPSQIKHYMHLNFSQPEAGPVGQLQRRLLQHMEDMVPQLITMQHTELANDIKTFVAASTAREEAEIMPQGRAQKTQPAPVAAIA